MPRPGYQIFLFRGNKGARRLVTVRGWLLVLPVCALAALAALNVALWKYYAGHDELCAETRGARGVLPNRKPSPCG
jgi:hypothetical protein